MESFWLPLLVAGAFLALLYWFKRGSVLKTDTAVALLKQGAVVVDVRTPAEFKSEALPGAINLPLDQLAKRAREQLPDPGTVLLVYCLSGGRSLVARSTLKRQGYSQVHNLGSLAQARAMIQESGR